MISDMHLSPVSVFSFCFSSPVNPLGSNSNPSSPLFLRVHGVFICTVYQQLWDNMVFFLFCFFGVVLFFPPEINECIYPSSHCAEAPAGQLALCSAVNERLSVCLLCWQRRFITKATEFSCLRVAIAAGKLQVCVCERERKYASLFFSVSILVRDCMGCYCNMFQTAL